MNLCLGVALWFLNHQQVFHYLLDIIAEIHWFVATDGHVVHIHYAFVRLVLGVGIANLQIGVRAGGYVFPEKVGLYGGVYQDVEVLGQKTVYDSLFRQLEEVEVLFLMADGGPGMREDVVNLIIRCLKSYQEHFLALVLLCGDETVYQVPLVRIAYSEDETDGVDVFPVLNPFIPAFRKHVSQLTLLDSFFNKVKHIIVFFLKF